MADNHSAVNRQSELLDVQLLDGFAQIEALLRHGREVQRAALGLRGVPGVARSGRRALAGTIRQHIDQMIDECQTFTDMLQDMQQTAVHIEGLVQEEEAAS